MRIRQGDVADAAAISIVHVRSWQAAYRGAVPQEYLDGLDPDQRRPVWERRLAEASWPGRGVLVAEAGGRIVGFTAFGPTRDTDADPATVGEVASIYLVREAWGGGIGTALFAAAVESLSLAGHREATLWVLESNARARRFYDAAGWRADGGVKHHTVLGAPLTMVRYRRALGAGGAGGARSGPARPDAPGPSGS